jgi:5-methyltetrahydropteroyltriglutamate--homocysteine methyltransferase
MLRTAVIGSWPLPPRYSEVLRAYHRREVLEARAEPVLREAAAIALREQKATGVTRVTGGEMFADPELNHLMRHLSGIVLSQPDADPAPAGGAPQYRLVGTLGAPRGLGYAAAYRRERSLDSQHAVATCPGPMSVLHLLVRSDGAAFSALPEATALVQREIRALVKEGAREIQLDAPVESISIERYALDPSVAASAIEAAFRGVRNVERTVHFCSRFLPGTDEQDHLRSLLAVIRQLSGKVDRVFIECTSGAAIELLAEIPSDLTVLCGIAEVAGEVAPVDVLVRRGRDALRLVSADRVWLAPACGLRGCASERAVQILANLVAASRRLPH